MQKSKLEIVRIKAKNKGIKGEIEISSRKEKKFMLKHDNRTIYFGATGHLDFLDTNDPKRRKAFHARFRNNVNYNKPYTAMYLAKLLW